MPGTDKNLSRFKYEETTREGRLVAYIYGNKEEGYRYQSVLYPHLAPFNGQHYWDDDFERRAANAVANGTCKPPKEERP